MNFEEGGLISAFFYAYNFWDDNIYKIICCAHPAGELDCPACHSAGNFFKVSAAVEN